MPLDQLKRIDREHYGYFENSALFPEKKAGMPRPCQRVFMVRNVRAFKPKRYNRLAANASSAS